MPLNSKAALDLLSITSPLKPRSPLCHPPIATCVNT